MERLQALHQQLDGSMNILTALREGKLTRTAAGEVMAHGALGWKVFEDDDANVLMSKYQSGASWPDHEHSQSSELLICTAGEFVIVAELPEGELTCCLKRGNCFKMPPQVVHSVKCTQAGKLIAVCVPPETGY